MSDIEQKLKEFGVSQDDIDYFAQSGKSLESVYQELEALSSEGEELEVVSAATLENGFMDRLTSEEVQAHIQTFSDHIKDRSFAFVVPAAGAASRQFQLLRTVLYHEEMAGLSGLEEIEAKAKSIVSQVTDDPSPTAEQQAAKKVMDEVACNVGRFWNQGIVEGGYAFLDDLKQVMDRKGNSFSSALEQGDVRSVMRFILEEDGLNYGALPKVLMRYHSYTDSSGRVENRLALEDHLRVGAQLFSGAKSVRMHFVISEEHESFFETALQEIREKPEFQDWIRQHGFSDAEIQVSWDFQKRSTDSVALEVASGKIARDEQGRPLLRKAGHGALLPNLAALDVDGVWLQNVDNILYGKHELRSLVVAYKKIMAGLALGCQKEAFEIASALAKPEESDAKKMKVVEQGVEFLRKRLLIDLPVETIQKERSASELSDLLLRIFDRPLVAAGYVPLAPGQAGGGPFVIEQEFEPGVTVQKVNTVEGSEFKEGQSSAVFQSGHFFNPVNLFVLKGRTDGSRYDLLQYQDEDRCFISSKSDSRGVPIKAYERPGLWNGALARALQVSIATPSNTFAAVKDCAGKESFLHPLHQPDFHEPLFTELDRERGVVDEELESLFQELQ